MPEACFIGAVRTPRSTINARYPDLDIQHFHHVGN